MSNLEITYRNILKSHGFVLAAELMDLSRTPNKVLRRMISSWDTYPICMNRYPSILSKKDMSYIKDTAHV